LETELGETKNKFAGLIKERNESAEVIAMWLVKEAESPKDNGRFRDLGRTDG